MSIATLVTFIIYFAVVWALVARELRSMGRQAAAPRVSYGAGDGRT